MRDEMEIRFFASIATAGTTIVKINENIAYFRFCRCEIVICKIIEAFDGKESSRLSSSGAK